MDFSKFFDLSGRTALVTGSSQGIGREIALTLAVAGANIVIHGLHDNEQFCQTVKDVEATGVAVFGVTADISDSNETARLIAESKAVLGTIDILILNASFEAFQPLAEFNAATFYQIYDTNLKSAIELINAVVPDMTAGQWGRIISIGSVNQWKPSANLPVYATSKAAVVNLIMNCARQFAPFGITANNIAPGVIATQRNHKQLSDPAYRERIVKMIPVGHLGETCDCSALALLLSSEGGRFITGADIPVTGGMHL